MITFSSTLKSLLANCTNKQQWSDMLISTLGSTRRVRAKRDASATAADPWATGTEFVNAAMTGTIKTTGGNISNFGIVGASTIQQSADLSSGKAVVRIEGNGEWVQGTLGLLGSGCDFIVSTSATAKSGFGFNKTTGLKAPLFLPSGTGPAAPELDADAPVFYQMFSYPVTNAEADRVPMGVKAINVREPDMVFDRDYIAKQIGDVRVMRSAEGDGTVFGTGNECFRFAPTLLVSNKATNATDPTKPVYRMRFLATPHGRWKSFPYRPDFKIEADTLSPTAFKIELYRANMTLIDVIEMYSTRVNDVPGTGKPVNGHDQYCDAGSTTVDPNYPVQPWWTCQMSLSWQSARYVPSTYINALHPGVEAQALDLSNVIEYDAWPDDWPVVTGNTHANGLMAVRVCPKWSRKRNSGYDTTIVDTKFQGPWRDEFRTQLIGYGYEPGSTCQHVWYMSPGGSRHERGMWPHYTVVWVSNRNAIREHGAVPVSELQHHFSLGYHNEGCHYVTNPELGKTLDKDHVLYGLDCYNDTYYNGGNEEFRSQANAIRLLTQGNQVHNRPFNDYRGRSFVSEYQRDDQHNISDAAMMTYFNNDPMGALESRDTFNSNMMCAFNMTQGFSADQFLTRQHAWYFKHLVEAWTIGNNNANGLSSAEVEFMATRHLNWVYNAVNALMNSNTIEGSAMRDLGAQCTVYYGDDRASGSIQPYDSKEFYFANIMMFAKQTGFYDRMRAIDPKNVLALDLMMNSLCKASVDFFVDGNGRYDKAGVPFIPFVTASLPTTWNWAMYPENQKLDWLHNAAGNMANNEGDTSYVEGYNTQHLRAQFLWVLKYFYPEINFPRLDTAITKVRGWYDEVEARKVAGGPNWHWRFAMFGIPLAPAKVGPPVVM
jgi:hypothetical protein